MIDYNKLFPFDKYREEIEALTKANQEFGEAAKQALGTFSKELNTLTKFLSDYRTTFEAADVTQKSFVTTATKASQVIDENGERFNNLTDSIKGMNETIASANKSVNGLAERQKQLKKEYEDLDSAKEKDILIMAAVAKEYKQNQVELDNLKNALKDSAKEIKNADGSYNALSKKLVDLKNQLRNIPGAFNEMTGEINTTNPQVKALGDEIKKYDTALKKADETMGQFTRNVGNYEIAGKALKTEMRELTNQIAQLKLEGKDTGPEFEKIVTRAGELKMALKDTQDEVGNLGNKFLTIKGTADILQGIGGAAAIAEGGMALFGVESDKVAETIVRLQAIQTTMMGIQQVANMFDKEAAAIVMITNAQKKIKVLLTHLEGAAESKNIIIRKAATVAQWLLNKAMLANPAGILIAVVALLAGAVLLLAKRNDDATKSQIRLNEAQKLYLELVKEQWEIFKRQNEEEFRKAQNAIDLAKAQGKSQLELIALQDKLFEKKREYYDRILKQNSAELAQLPQFEQAYLNQLKLVNALKTAKAENKSFDFAKNVDSRDKTRGVKDDDIKAQEGKLEVIRGRLDFYRQMSDDIAKFQQDLSVNAAAREKYNADQEKKSIMAIKEARVTAAKEGSKQEYLAQIDLIKAKRQVVYDDVNSTKGERIKADADANEAIEKATKDYNRKIAESEVNTRIDIINTNLAFATGSDEELRLKQQLVDEQARLDIIAANNSILNEEEKRAKIAEIYAQSLKDKQELEWAKNKAEDDAKERAISSAREIEKVRAEITLNSPGSTRKQRKQAASILMPENDLKAIDDEIQRTKDLKDIKFRTEEEYQARLDELTLLHEQKRLEIAKQKAEELASIRQGVLDIISTGLLGALENQRAASELALARAQQEGQSRLSIIDGSRQIELARAGDDANKRAAIEEKYNELKYKQEQETNRKINAEKRKQAIIARDEALFNIAINIAQAVAKVWASTGLAAAILQSIPIAIGAIQAGIVMSRKLPAYKHGIESAPEGLAVVNDQPGPTFKELIIRKGKAYMPEGRNQLVYMHHGDKIINAAETQGILANAQRQSDINRMINQSLLYGSLANNLSVTRKLEVEHSMINAMKGISIDSKPIVDAINSRPVQELHLDENGYRSKLRYNNTLITKLNNSNSL